MNVGKAIKQIRKERRLTQSDLSAITGISQTSLSKIEGGTMPSTDNLKKIADALGTPVSILYVLAMDKDDVPENKKEKFDLLYPAIKSLALKIVDLEE